MNIFVKRFMYKSFFNYSQILNVLHDIGFQNKYNIHIINNIFKKIKENMQQLKQVKHYFQNK